MTKARGPVELDATLFNDVLARISNLHPGTPDYAGDDALAKRLEMALFYDSCMDDGEYDGYCSKHNERIEYWVDNFSDEGKVIALGTVAPAIEDMATCFPVCPGAQEYRHGVVEVGYPADPDIDPGV